MSLISNESMTIKDKTFRLTLRIVESVLKVLKVKGIQNYNSFLSERMGTPRSNISRMLNCDGNITIKTLLKLLDAAELEMEVKFYDRSTLKPVDHVSVSTVKLPAELKPLQIKTPEKWQIELVKNNMRVKSGSPIIDFPPHYELVGGTGHTIRTVSQRKYLATKSTGERT